LLALLAPITADADASEPESTATAARVTVS